MVDLHVCIADRPRLLSYGQRDRAALTMIAGRLLSLISLISIPRRPRGAIALATKRSPKLGPSCAAADSPVRPAAERHQPGRGRHCTCAGCA